MNKFPKIFLLLTLFASNGLKPAAADDYNDPESLFVSNPGFLVDADDVVLPEITARLNENIRAEVAFEILVDQIIAEEVATTKALITHERQQLTFTRLTVLKEELMKKVQERRETLRGSVDVFKKEIYESLNLTTTSIISSLESQILLILAAQQSHEAIITLLKDYLSKNTELEKAFKKSHRSDSKKQKIRDLLIDMQRIEYSIQGIINDAFSAHRTQSRTQ